MSSCGLKRHQKTERASRHVIIRSIMAAAATDGEPDGELFLFDGAGQGKKPNGPTQRIDDVQ